MDKRKLKEIAEEAVKIYFDEYCTVAEALEKAEKILRGKIDGTRTYTNDINT
ncbi:hypothetical protein [Crassaminicella thermophila]|uniref:hypothetical protein n=1 Tax=Crassaminicella thermophila TaxID=2599308 RepID=UPI00143DBE23|nr:hypothetical protein [Crassaminicella thermophila]